MNTEQVQSYIGGEWRAGPTPFADLNPHNPQEVVAEAHLADAAMAGEAIEAARQAFATWRAMPAPARGDILHRAADLLAERAKPVGIDLAREEGKTAAEGIGETRRAVAILRYYAGQTLEPDGETYPSASPITLLYARREPVGVVAAITPFNFPIAIPAWKIAPALAYGNTVVWKPAEVVPLTSRNFLQALIDAGLPTGVLNMVLGTGAEVGNVLSVHPGIDAITFTGSSAVGTLVQRNAIEHGAKVQLELGGKNPAIVLADADLAQAAEQVARGAFLSAGQKCTATSRVIVEQPVLDRFADLLAEKARTWRVGNPLERETQVGPLVSQPQLEKVLGYLDLAQQEGATVHAGGERVNELGGYYVKPTVFSGLSPRSRVVTEEIFGPVTTLIPVSSFDEAIHVANDTPYGLSASLFARDLNKAIRFAQEIRAGVVKVNQESAGIEFQVPFGGMKGSSSGSREQGKVARDFFTQWKTVYIDAIE